jgi:hypothetical protein
VAAAIPITPINTSTTLSNAQIEAELSAQITRGVLPLPDGSTMFAVFLPSSITGTLPGSGNSCVVGGFCAYHGSFQYDAVNTTFALMPDCGGGCSATVAGSHELIEAMTDPMIGFVGPGTSSNLGWYDDETPPCNGEVADLCEGHDYSMGKYTLAAAWSNDDAQCDVAKFSASTLEFAIQTGHDDLRQDSELRAIVTATDGSSQTITLKSTGAPAWNNGFSITQDFPLTLTAPIANVELELLESDPGCNISCDNWDLANLDVRILNPDGSHTCVVHAVGGTDSDQDAVARLTRDNNTVNFPDGQGCFTAPNVMFSVQTGHDDLRNDSELDAVLTGTDGSSQTIVLKPVGPTWPNGNTSTQNFAVTLTAAVSSIKLVLVESDPGCNISCDNWDLGNIQVTQLNGDGTQTCLVHLNGANGGIDNDQDAVARLTRDQNTVTFTSGQGCP